MQANKVILNGETIIDLTQDTVTETDVASGKTFHKADGTTAVGTLVSVNQLDNMLTDTVTEINSSISAVCSYACYARTKLKMVNLPNATKLGTNAFRACTQLVECKAPNATTLESYLFYVCSNLTSASFPVATSIPNYCFGSCAKFTKADFGSATTVNASAFASSSNFQTLILRSTTMATLANVNALSGTKIAGGTGYIYVPKELVDSYKVATNWSTFSAQFRAIEDYPDICG